MKKRPSAREKGFVVYETTNKHCPSLLYTRTRGLLQLNQRRMKK
jgi:hypothetical protein